MACQGGPMDLPIAATNLSTSWPLSAVVARLDTSSRSYQRTDQPRDSAAVARASRYMIESATLDARVSLIRSSIVSGSLGQARIAIAWITMGTVEASFSRLLIAPRAAASRTFLTNATASGRVILRAQGLLA